VSGASADFVLTVEERRIGSAVRRRAVIELCELRLERLRASCNVGFDLDIGFLLIFGGEAVMLLFVSCVDVLVPPHVGLLLLFVEAVDVTEAGRLAGVGRMLSDDGQTQEFWLVCAVACELSG